MYTQNMSKIRNVEKIYSCESSQIYSDNYLLQILLKFNVSINALDALGRSALHYACYTGKSEVAKVLVNEDGIELNTQDYEGTHSMQLRFYLKYDGDVR